ncbi:MAG TPA: type II toxin-antitoxin system HicB family antitoxin [Candidatus Onthovicinus excrementipullorum]|nr:type II toxin-antitoxin system HicB family antitoxin [Candidatus Onthovicinus excrementipullorum]
MNNVFYPAVFFKEQGGYSVRIPDIDGCFSEGDTMDEACQNALDAIGLNFEGMSNYPTPSEPDKIALEKGEFVVMLEFDMIDYRRRNDTRAVKKTLTIPSWLNSMAEENHINFSSVLQTALKHQLNISDRA